MKKKLLTIIFLLSTTYCFSQGNLQFNNVLLVTDVLQTVPTGKVWKIESIAIDPVGTGNIVESQGYIANDPGGVLCQNRNISNGFWEINGDKRMCSGAAVSTGGSLPSASCFPFWLPAGTTLKTMCPAATLSVIEFNICPNECND